MTATLPFQEKQDGSPWGRRRGECCAGALLGLLLTPSAGVGLWECWEGEVGVLGWWQGVLGGDSGNVRMGWGECWEEAVRALG